MGSENNQIAPRMVEKAKAYLVERFNSGVSSGQKADPVQVAMQRNEVCQRWRRSAAFPAE